MKSRYALIGGKLGHSYSPTIHEKVFKQLGIDGEYTLIELKKEELPIVIEKLRSGELLGINITIPYKTDIMEFLDEISQEAKSIGAVNTVISKNGKLIGYNTDYYGFKMTVEKLGIEIKEKKNFVCGAGGSARAVLKSLEDMGSKNYLVTRDVKKAKIGFSTFKNLEVITYKELDNIDNKNIIVNCTPCGMYPNIESSVLEVGAGKNYNAGIDIIYNPKKTKFLSEFELGENGLFMLVGQAIKAEEIWQNKKINDNIIEKIYNEVSLEVYEIK